MFTFTRRQRRVTALRLFLLFAGALGLTGLYAVWCGPAHHARPLVASQPKAPAATHSCCAAKAAKAARSADPTKAPECCAHEKAAKWASVPDAPLGKLLKPALEGPALLPGGFGWDVAAGRNRWATRSSVRWVPPRHLPPKIPDVRVFLHSLAV